MPDVHSHSRFDGSQKRGSAQLMIFHGFRRIGTLTCNTTQPCHSISRREEKPAASRNSVSLQWIARVGYYRDFQNVLLCRNPACKTAIAPIPRACTRQ